MFAGDLLTFEVGEEGSKLILLVGVKFTPLAAGSILLLDNVNQLKKEGEGAGGLNGIGQIKLFDNRQQVGFQGVTLGTHGPQLLQ